MPPVNKLTFLSILMIGALLLPMTSTANPVAGSKPANTKSSPGTNFKPRQKKPTPQSDRDRIFQLESNLHYLEKKLEENNRWLESNKEALDNYSQNMTIIFSIAGILIAIASVGFSLLFGRQQRKDNKRALEDVSRLKEEVAILNAEAQKHLTEISQHHDHVKGMVKDIEHSKQIVEELKADAVLSDEDKKATEEISSSNDVKPALVHKAAALMAQVKNDWETAATHWKKITELESENADAWFGLGCTNSQIWKNNQSQTALETARMAFEKTIQLDSQNPGAYSNWGLALAEQAKQQTGDDATRLFQQANEKYHQATTLKPDNSEIYNNWGVAIAGQARQQTGDEATRLFQQAIEKYKHATTLKSDYANAYNNWGNALGDQARQQTGDEATRLLQQAIEKYQQATTLKPDNPEVFSNWGLALAGQARQQAGDEAKRLFQQAIEKYQQATTLNRDYADAYDNWGTALLNLTSNNTVPEEREKLLQEAEEKCLEADRIKPGTGAYNLACVFGIRGDEEEVKKWLYHAKKHNTLPDAQYLMTDTDLESVRNTDWFKELIDSLKE